jgi:hypothetical protein
VAGGRGGRLLKAGKRQGGWVGQGRRERERTRGKTLAIAARAAVNNDAATEYRCRIGGRPAA